MGNKIKPWRRRDRRHLKHAVKKHRKLPEVRHLHHILDEIKSEETASLPIESDPVE